MAFTTASAGDSKKTLRRRQPHVTNVERLNTILMTVMKNRQSILTTRRVIDSLYLSRIGAVLSQKTQKVRSNTVLLRKAMKQSPKKVDMTLNIVQSNRRIFFLAA